MPLSIHRNIHVSCRASLNRQVLKPAQVPNSTRALSLVLLPGAISGCSPRLGLAGDLSSQSPAGGLSYPTPSAGGHWVEATLAFQSHSCQRTTSMSSALQDNPLPLMLVPSELDLHYFVSFYSYSREGWKTKTGYLCGLLCIHKWRAQECEEHLEWGPVYSQCLRSLLVQFQTLLLFSKISSL